MSAKSDYLEAAQLNHIFRGIAFSAVATTYIALFTAAPSDAGGGIEVSGGAYARAAVTSAAGAWSDPAGTGSLSNSADVTFPVPTADWGLVTHFAIYDAASAGNLLYHGPLTQSKTISNGSEAPVFAAGTLVVTED